MKADRMHKNDQVNGQGLIEFALVLPILLLLIIGALDYGFAFFIKVELENSAREGAFYMVYHAHESGAVDEARNRVQLEGENAGIPISLSDIDVVCMVGTVEDSTCPGGSTVIVTTHYQMPLAVDIFGNGPLELTGDARMQIP
jgi:Flp pilus assembly protein TadG